ncbi:uncharacterized protein LOC100889580 [Strongylocentrotus purpuratus]|uniref:Uncharacterized protein n=1 Tax=Strongylocentrotus purpuratus TaxID=7668 RepID=A0A7M7GET3_STRPU|nr:uncharacterized protein LOC100889580 [Strongylocentrotus purpuratus]
METPPRKCQVVMRKINLGEKATMHRCVVPIKRLQISNRTSLKSQRGSNKLSHVQLQKLQVLLQKLKLSKDRLDQPIVVQGDNGHREDAVEKTLLTVQLRKLRVLLNKLKPNDRCDVTVTKENEEKPVKSSLSNFQLLKFKVLLSKVKLNKDGSIMAHDKENRDNVERTLSNVQLHKLKILLSKLKVSNDIQDSSIIVDKECGIVTCQHSLSAMNKKRFRVLLRRLKLNNILKGHDHTLFIDKELGFVTNPYLLPSYCRGHVCKPHHSVLKFRRSRARQCRVRIKKINL